MKNVLVYTIHLIIKYLSHNEAKICPKMYFSLRLRPQRLILEWLLAWKWRRFDWSPVTSNTDIQTSDEWHPSKPWRSLLVTYGTNVWPFLKMFRKCGLNRIRTCAVKAQWSWGRNAIHWATKSTDNTCMHKVASFSVLIPASTVRQPCFTVASCASQQRWNNPGSEFHFNGILVLPFS